MGEDFDAVAKVARSHYDLMITKSDGDDATISNDVVLSNNSAYRYNVSADGMLSEEGAAVMKRDQ